MEKKKKTTEAKKAFELSIDAIVTLRKGRTVHQRYKFKPFSAAISDAASHEECLVAWKELIRQLTGVFS